MKSQTRRSTGSSLQPACAQEHVPKLQLLQGPRAGTELFYIIPSPQLPPKERNNKAQGTGLGGGQWVPISIFSLGLWHLHHHSKQRALGSKDSMHVCVCTGMCVLFLPKKQTNKTKTTTTTQTNNLQKHKSNITFSVTLNLSTSL